MKSEKVALITGATGFVGSHLSRRLVNEGWKIHIITRQSTKLEIISDIIKKITVQKHDGTINGMLGILSEAKPMIVFHLASFFLAEHQSKDVVPLIESNLLFGTQLVEAMVRNGIYNLVNTGTSWQHNNDEKYRPVNLYAATKEAFETILRFYVEATPLRVITLKLFDTYGPNDTRPKLFNLLRSVAQEQRPLAMSPGEQLIDIVYIDDVVDAFMKAAERLFKGKTEKQEDYAVSSGKAVKLKDIVGIYEKIIGKKLPIKWGGRPYRSREVMMPWKKGRLLPGWRIKVGLEEGIKKFIQ